MAVEVLTQDYTNIPRVVFLKLYDRRFAPQWRSDWGLDPWTPALEEELLEFSRCSSSEAFMRRLREDPDASEDDEGWTDAQHEACLSHKLQCIFQTEKTVYGELSHHQGSLIPKLYGAVTMGTSTSPSSDGVGSSPVIFDIPGLLLEYIDGFAFSELAYSSVGRSEWQYLADRAVRATNHVLLESNVLNDDVRPDNMMVCEDQNYERGYRVIMIDFGSCRLRKDGETIEEWGLEKHRQDEEGAMGAVLQIQLRNKAGFELEYNRSLKWRQYAERD